MPAGIEVYNADGSLQFDITTRLFRVLVPDFSTTSSSGSITVPNQGQVVVATNMNEGGNNSPGTVTVSGGTVSWTSGQSMSGAVLVF